MVTAVFTFLYDPLITILKGAGPPGAPRRQLTLHRTRDVAHLRGARSGSCAQAAVHRL